MAPNDLKWAKNDLWAKDSEFLPNSAIETQKTQKFGVNSEILTPLEPLLQAAFPGFIKFKLHYVKLLAHFMNNLAYFMNNSIFKRLVPDQANTKLVGLHTHDLMHLGSKMIQETPSLCLPQQNRRKSWP